jgi:hypothetical protein
MNEAHHSQLDGANVRGGRWPTYSQVLSSETGIEDLRPGSLTPYQDYSPFPSMK